MSMETVASPEQHRAYPRLTADQRKAVNEWWDEIVIPALEEVEAMRNEVTAARMEAQDARWQAREARAAHARLLWETRADG
jgi:hypothetical protein